MATETERRAYTPEFKAEALQLLRDGDPLEDVAASLDVSVPVLRTWVLLDEVAQPRATRTPSPLAQAPAAVAAKPFAPSQTAAAPIAGPMQYCMVCGRGPARTATLRSVKGIFVGFRRRRINGTFCRDCGIAMTRRTLDRTLLTGWWGLFASFFNLYAAGLDAGALRQFRRLPAPIGQPMSAPVPAGRSLFRRAGVYVGAAVMALSLYVGFAVIGAPVDAAAFDGKCIAFGATKIVATPTCASAHDARVVAVVSNKFQCPDTADVTTRPRASSSNVLCIDLDQ